MSAHAPGAPAVAVGWLAWRGECLARVVLVDVLAVHHECQALRAPEAGQPASHAGGAEALSDRRQPEPWARRSG